MSPLNIKAKDLCVLYEVSLRTAKRNIKEIKAMFNISSPKTVTHHEVAAYFGTDPDLLLSRIIA